MTVKKARDVQDTAILHALEQASITTSKKWLFIEDVLPKYRLAVGALRVPSMHQSTVTRRLEKLADRGMVVVSRKPKSVKLRGATEERNVRAYRLATLKE